MYTNAYYSNASYTSYSFMEQRIYLAIPVADTEFVMFFSVFLILCVVVLCKGNVGLSPIKLLRSKFNEEIQRIKICSVFNFSSRVGSVAYEKLFMGEKSDQNVATLSFTNPLELLQLGGGNIGVGFLNRIDTKFGGGSLLSFVQSFVDGVSRSKQTSSTLVVVVESNASPASAFIEEQVRAIAKEAESVHCKIEVCLQSCHHCSPIIAKYNEFPHITCRW